MWVYFYAHNYIIKIKACQGANSGQNRRVGNSRTLVWEREIGCFRTGIRWVVERRMEYRIYAGTFKTGGVCFESWIEFGRVGRVGKEYVYGAGIMSVSGERFRNWEMTGMLLEHLQGE